MHPETLNKPLRTARTFVRRSLSERLRAAIIALADGHGKVAGHSEKSWASITFAGTRHSLQLVFEGCDAVKASTSWLFSRGCTVQVAYTNRPWGLSSGTTPSRS